MEQTSTINLQEELIRKCKSGDKKSQYRLYKMYSRSLYNAVLRIVSNSMDAEDVLQDSFIKAFQNIHTLDNTKALSSWLRRIAINEALGFLRQKKISFLSIDIDIVAEEEEDWEDVPMELIHNKIKTLPEGCRVIFNLFLLEEYSHKEIANVLSISESTSKTQYKRAKQLLQQSLKTHYEKG